jgi:predicted metalloendopeptidase
VPENLGWILGRFYLNEYYPEINKKTVESMTTNLKQEYRKIISSNPWLEASVKSKALLKIDKMVISSEYPNSVSINKHHLSLCAASADTIT